MRVVIKRIKYRIFDIETLETSFSHAGISKTIFLGTYQFKGIESLSKTQIFESLYLCNRPNIVVELRYFKL